MNGARSSIPQDRKIEPDPNTFLIPGAQMALQTPFGIRTYEKFVVALGPLVTKIVIYYGIRYTV